MLAETSINSKVFIQQMNKIRHSMLKPQLSNIDLQIRPYRKQQKEMSNLKSLTTAKQTQEI